MLEKYRKDFKAAIIELNKREALDVFKAFETTCPDQDFFDLIARTVLEDIGDSWSKGEVSLAQVYMSGSICESIIKEKYGDDSQKQAHDTYDIAVVTLDDFHPLGKKLLTAVLNAYQIHVLDLGFGLSIPEIVDQLEAHNIRLLLVSVLMLPSALKVKALKSEVLSRQLKVKIMVGGSPFRLDQDLWQAVNADYVGDAPIDAVHLIHHMRRCGQ